MSRNYRDRVRRMKDRSAAGAQQPDYRQDLSGIPCKIMPKNGREANRGEQLEATVTHVIEMRHYPNIAPNDIFENEVDGKQYIVTSVINVEQRSRQLIIHATEVIV